MGVLDYRGPDGADGNENDNENEEFFLNTN